MERDKTALNGSVLKFLNYKHNWNCKSCKLTNYANQCKKSSAGECISSWSPSHGIVLRMLSGTTLRKLQHTSDEKPIQSSEQLLDYGRSERQCWKQQSFESRNKIRDSERVTWFHRTPSCHDELPSGVWSLSQRDVTHMGTKRITYQY